MPHPDLINSFFIIFAGAAGLATVALFSRQPMLIAYILLGCLIGPFGLSLIDQNELLTEIAEIGIIFLLFLVGLDLQPSKLKNMLAESMLTALGTSILFFAMGASIMLATGFSYTEAWVVGLAMTFSSTILGIKLLPTTALHHRHIGEMVVSLLLIQDLLAILAILLLTGLGNDLAGITRSLMAIFVGLPLLIGGAYLMVRFVLLTLISKFDAFHEYIFLLAIGWCLSLASIAEKMGLSFEIGGFIAGVSLATSPIAQYIAEHLKPLRDFFLILFFFSVGASLNVVLLQEVWLATIILAVVTVIVKPRVFAYLLVLQKEDKDASKEVGFRLGQASEFSLLLSYIAISNALISSSAAVVLQTATILTLIGSSYLVVSRYPSPIASDPALRRD
ncbi:MAG: cation:proton antiporter [Pseudomonadales bacterium]|jgi:Kef-type K+ transport system membrane component KefB|nr:cation:proton antiporter [Pseudomonadales bacterium]